MDNCFNLNKLENIYKEALESFDKSFAVELKIAQGEFLLMMFISEEDEETKDFLFIYMRNSNVLKRVKMYGNHSKGCFQIYMTNALETAIFKELNLRKSNGNYNIEKFIEQLNIAIPYHLNYADKIKCLRSNRNIIDDINVVDESEKTVLIGDKKVSHGKPRDKTLRKLYLYTNANPKDIDVLIKLLKSLNRTVAWTTEEQRYRAKEVHEIITLYK